MKSFLRTIFYYLRRIKRHTKEIYVRYFSATCGAGLKIHGSPRLDMLEHIHIGKNVVINHNAIITARHDPVYIGDNVTISAGAFISSAGLNTKKAGGRHNGAPVTIGNNVWIAAHAVILPGVSIGDNATIAAGAVVTKDVPEGVTVAGIPARVIRSHET
jgi:maltose O-acetyltransferase